MRDISWAMTRKSNVEWMSPWATVGWLDTFRKRRRRWKITRPMISAMGMEHVVDLTEWPVEEETPAHEGKDRKTVEKAAR